MRFGLAVVTSIALPAALLTGVSPTAASATPGSSEYAAWTLSGDQGTVKVANVGATGTFTTSGANASIASGSSAWLSDSTPFGLVFGSSRGEPYLSTGIAAGSTSATVTYSFSDPGRVGSWAFALGDIDAETVTISANDTNGRAININYWFEGVFNYCGSTGAIPSTCAGSSGTDVPSWDPATATLIGTGVDTAGATGWFRPIDAVRTLKIEMTGLSGIPRYQTWFAAQEEEYLPEYSVTVAARQCPSYQDIMANKARNNSMESLEDLGVDSIYPTVGGLVRPEVEDDTATGQGACTPLTGWTFGFGNGFGPPDTGPFGSLTTVANLNGTATTIGGVPVRDELGNPTSQVIAGANTFVLDDTQTSIIKAGGSLTVQGGIPGTPLNGSSSLAFGVLRCASDNINGDNVEYLNFPAGLKHVFCYAYYVDQTPAPGFITVTKEVAGPSTGVSFTFSGNTSYNPGGAFSLENGQSEMFTRQSGQTWTIIEEENAPYTLKDIVCTGGSNVVVDVEQRKVAIDLGEYEEVDCTFKNSLSPKSSLEIYKVSENGVGTFSGEVSGPDGYLRPWSATTTVQSEAVPGFDDTGLFAGTYRVSEAAPQDWATGVACGYRDDTTIITSEDSFIDVPLARDQAAVCLFVNYLNIPGGITVRSTIVGGSGAVNAESQYRVAPISGVSTGEVLVLSNTAWNSPESGSARGPLPLGSYSVKGNPPAPTATNTWSVDSVTCTAGGSVVGTEANVVLDSTNPNVTCDYVYRAEPINPTLTVSKSVTQGNELRTSAVVIDVLCSTGSGPFRSTIILPLGTSSAASLVTLPTDTTSCSAVESSTGEPGAVDPGTILVTADGSEWPEGETRSVSNGSTLAVGAISSSTVPVFQSGTGPCVITAAGITPRTSDGTCTVTFTAYGGAVLVESSWTAPNGSGSGTQTSNFNVTPGGAYAISFQNEYSGVQTQTTTTRQIQAESNPGTLVVTKTVPEGNSLRTGPVTIEVTCTVSAAADPDAWPKVLTLDPSKASATWTIPVSGNVTNNDLCTMTETSDGAPPRGPGKINPTWNGKRWKATAAKSLAPGESARVNASSTTGARVTRTTTEPCDLDGSRLTADRTGTCTIDFTAEGFSRIDVSTTYPNGRAFVTSPGQTSQAVISNRYFETPRTISTQRSVEVTALPACPLDVDAASSVPVSGTTLLLRSVTTSDGCEITKVKVTCTSARITPRGDFGCTVREDPKGRIYVTTYGDPSIVVRVTIVAKGEDHVTTRWKRNYRVT